MEIGQSPQGLTARYKRASSNGVFKFSSGKDGVGVNYNPESFEGVLRQDEGDAVALAMSRDLSLLKNVAPKVRGADVWVENSGMPKYDKNTSEGKVAISNAPSKPFSGEEDGTLSAFMNCKHGSGNGREDSLSQTLGLKGVETVEFLQSKNRESSTRMAADNRRDPDAPLRLEVARASDEMPEDRYVYFLNSNGTISMDCESNSGLNQSGTERTTS